jgi:hypothetical protein
MDPYMTIGSGGDISSGDICKPPLRLIADISFGRRAAELIVTPYMAGTIHV